jgi:hypothetical protein
MLFLTFPESIIAQYSAVCMQEVQRGTAILKDASEGIYTAEKGIYL